jgi:hypothetical protein
MKIKATDIIVAPLVTEKSTGLKEKERLLCFKVHRDVSAGLPAGVLTGKKPMSS